MPASIDQMYDALFNSPVDTCYTNMICNTKHRLCSVLDLEVDAIFHDTKTQEEVDASFIRETKLVDQLYVSILGALPGEY